MTSPKTNPLAEYSSYTYQITWYICTPEQYNGFVNQGRVAKTGDIVVQSGGVGADESRAAGFKYDYYIENTKLKTVLGGKVSTTIEISFDVIEPMGFSFIHDLKIAAGAVRDKSSLPGVSKINNAIKHFNVLGIRFLGYDANGTPQPPKYESFYDFQITEFKFKIDGKATVYHITAAVTPDNTAMGQIEGRTVGNMSVSGGTVGEVVNDLIAKLNKEQELLLQPKTGEDPKAEFVSTYLQVDWTKANKIEESIMSENPDLDKSTTHGNQVKEVGQSNPKYEKKTSPNFKDKMIQFKDSTSIVQVLEGIIGNSAWFRDRHNQELKNRPLEDPTTRPGLLYQDIRITAKAEAKAYDKKRGMWVYNYTFAVHAYDVEALRNTFITDSGKWPGAHKSYEYWFTGKNTEVLKYEHVMDMAYFMTMPGVSDNDDPKDVIKATTQRTNEVRQGSQGKGAEIRNSSHRQMIDIGSNAESKLLIYGDPDYLMNNPDPEGSTSDYQSDARTINGSSGWVYIDISFREAIDYTPTGYLELSDDFVLWEQNYPGAIRYVVISIDSTLARGLFQQELTLAIATLEKYSPPTKSKNETTQADE